MAWLFQITACPSMTEPFVPLAGKSIKKACLIFNEPADRKKSRRMFLGIKCPRAHLAFVMEGETGYKQGDFDRFGHWYGVRRFFQFLEQNTYKMHVRVFLSKYRSYVKCPDCGGARLQGESLHWKWENYRLPDLYELPVKELHDFTAQQISRHWKCPSGHGEGVAP